MIVGSLLLILVAVLLLVVGLATGSSGLLISSIAASLLAAVALVVGARQAVAGRVESDGLDDTGHVRAAKNDRHTSPRRAGAGPRVGEPVWRPDGTSSSAGYPGPRGGDSPYAGFEDPSFEGPGFDGPLLADPVERAVPTQTGRGPQEPGSGVDQAGRGADPGGADGDDMGWRPPAGPDGAARPAADAGAVSGVGEPATEDDPADEPAPQRLSAAQAARLIRLDADVLVVDGRPRFHLRDCPHLLGRKTETLPVSEAMELGFTPCTRCEPASALLAETRHG